MNRLREKISAILNFWVFLKKYRDFCEDGTLSVFSRTAASVVILGKIFFAENAG
jgi:hypothetical protein